MNLKTDTKNDVFLTRQIKIITQLILTFLFLFFLTNTFSQKEKPHSQLEIRTGITTGSPIVIKNIPADATGSPGIGLNVGLEYTYIFHRRFSFTLGAAYAKKGSSFASPISGKYDATRGVFGEQFPFPVRIKYTGDVEGGFNMTYLDFPILMNVRLKKWQIGVGYQYSKMLSSSFGGTVDIKALFLNFNNRVFDESEKIKDFDNSVILKIKRQLTNRFNIATDFTVSTQRLMTETEDGFSNPRNVFINVLIGFRIF